MKRYVWVKLDWKNNTRAFRTWTLQGDNK